MSEDPQHLHHSHHQHHDKAKGMPESWKLEEVKEHIAEVDQKVANIEDKLSGLEIEITSVSNTVQSNSIYIQAVHEKLISLERVLKPFTENQRRMVEVQRHFILDTIHKEKKKGALLILLLGTIFLCRTLSYSLKMSVSNKTVFDITTTVLCVSGMLYIAGYKTEERLDK